MELKYFGTDGIRGQAFAPPLTLDEAGRWGQAGPRWPARAACGNW